MAKQNNKPLAEIKLGLVKATIWENETTNGSRHNVNFSRLYKKEDRWHETTSFGRDDLPLLNKVADAAHTFIFEQKGEPFAAKTNS